jgi:hypothetical protein
LEAASAEVVLWAWHRYLSPESHHAWSPHTVQTLDELAPVLSLYVPAGHSVQTLDELAPMLSLYVPAGHTVQTLDELAPVLSLYVPAGHTSRPPSVHHPPAMHRVQIPAPP